MNKFKKYLSLEIANEFYASIYSMGIIGSYCIFALIEGKRTVDIFMIIQTLIVGYIITIIQNIIFYGNKTFTKKEYRVRVLLWHIVSNGIAFTSAIALNWFNEFPKWTLMVYLIFMIMMFLVLWKWMDFNKSIDSENLNKMLTMYQSKISVDEEDHQ